MENLQLSKFDAPGAIESVKNKVAPFAGLAISGMEDKAGYEAVRIAIGECVSTRTEFVSKCKAAREDATAYSKYVVEKEKEGVEAIRKLEDKLRAQKEKIDSEKEKIKAEKEQKIQTMAYGRSGKLSRYGYHHDLLGLRNMTEESFEALLESKKTEFEAAEKIRIDNETAERLEREEFAKKKAEQDAREKEIADREASILAKEREIEAERMEKARAEEILQNRKEAAERAEKETEERMKNERLAEERFKESERIRTEAEEKMKQEKLERNRRYKAWMTENGFTEEDMILSSEDKK